ncbi:MAG: hypothetical protein MEQ74_10680 [Paracoccus sp.]|nr:hypothetical protein [Paracoccus sp. (in: a-proteobacteria)]
MGAHWPVCWQMRHLAATTVATDAQRKGKIAMNSIIYIVGLIVVVLFVLSFLGLR